MFDPTSPFAERYHGICYSPLPSKFHTAPPQSPAEVAQFFDSDLCNDNFPAVWHTDGSCGREDLAAMNQAKFNLIRLYDYNYARGASQPGQVGHGHISFLDRCDQLGIKVIIPVSNWNFSNDQYAWNNIDLTVANIVESVKQNGVIHPAVHSFSVGNELDLDQNGLHYTVTIPRAIQVVQKLHALAPNYYSTIPVSNWQQMNFFKWFKDGDGGTITPIPADIYNSRFYNSVQTFKLGGAVVHDILESYDSDADLPVPLAITELGFSTKDAGSEDAMVDNVVGQASAAEQYLNQHGSSKFKFYTIFQWQDAYWKGPTTADGNYGIHNYDGTLCSSNTGDYNGNSPCGPIPSASYDVDKLLAKKSKAHPEGLVDALTTIFASS